MIEKKQDQGDGNAVPPGQLRDMAYIWLYLAVTNVNSIASNTITADALWNALAGHVSNTGSNKAILRQIYSLIQNDEDGAFVSVASDFVQLPGVVGVPWPANDHPGLGELDSIFK